MNALCAILLLGQAVVDKPVTLVGVGDVMLGRGIARRLSRTGPIAVLAGVRKEIESADVVVGNLECPITDEAFSVQKRFLLRASPSSAEALKGFSLLSLANNHSQDCGLRGVQSTKTHLQKAGIKTLGPEFAPEILTVKGQRVGLIGLCDLPANHWNGIVEKVAKLRALCDAVVVMLHWGFEYQTQPSGEQVELAQRLADAGADLVLGAHPHVLQPLRWVRSKSGHRCLVAFSLGNFVFDAMSQGQNKSAILHVTLTRQGVTEYRLIPVQIERGYPVTVH